MAVPPPERPQACEDTDGDGALPPGCGSPAEADCDNTDPKVGPATERWVPPGPFVMGSTTAEAGSDEGPVHIVTLDGYCLDRFAATQAQVATTLGRAPPAASAASLPADDLSWAQAQQHCAALGKRLPTEAQWEKAARGGCERGEDPGHCDPADAQTYPWGEAAPDCTLANHRAGSPPHLQACAQGVMPVDALAKGEGPYGHRQLAGNVWEFVSDPWHPRTYASGSPRVNPGGPPTGDIHGLRGGGHNTFATNMRVANRFQDLVEGSASGVRCARSATQPIADNVPPLSLVTLTGTVRAATGTLTGNHIYVTAFAAADLDPATQMPIPGRSPVAERKLKAGGMASQAFTLDVPAGEPVVLNASLSVPAPQPGMPASGAGGVGQSESKIPANADQDGIHIVLRPLPGAGAPRGKAPGTGPAAGPPGRAQPPGGRPPHGGGR